MKHKKSLLIGLAVALIFLISCSAGQGPEGPVGPAGPAGPPGPEGPQGEAATASQTFVGSDTCGSCHEAIYEEFSLSGHPYKLTKIEDGQPPTFPYDDLTGGVTDPPEGYSWEDISYVIGGFGWKARFIDQEGFIITGDVDATTQYNFANDDIDIGSRWVPYHPGEVTPYDCGSCHTTGFDPAGHQDDLEGIMGTWVFPGIQCEECHGPGGRHSEDPYGVQMVVDRSAQLCGDCHIRDNPAEIDASGGFERHHQQYEDLFNSKHFALSCVTCHDPHASSKFEDENVNPDKGLRQQCESCHWPQTFEKNDRHLAVECIDCHMPPMAMSAVGDLEKFTADIRSHQFSINPDPSAPQFSEDEAFVMPYITLDYACGQCHNGTKAGVRDAETMAAMAKGYHTVPTPTPLPTPTPVPTATPTPESDT